MGATDVLNEVEGAIIRICTDIKGKRGGSGTDKLDSLSKLVNSYSRLLERCKTDDSDVLEDGDPEYYKTLEKQNTSRKKVIR